MSKIEQLFSPHMHIWYTYITHISPPHISKSQNIRLFCDCNRRISVYNEISFSIYPHPMIQRTITPTLIKQCFTRKAIIIYWPRQVGKTTLVKQIQEQFWERPSLYVSGDENETREIRQPSSTILKSLVTGYDLIIIDEAQKIKEIGNILKLLVDTYPEKQIIATGSSSFDLAYSISEPLTWRAYIHHLYPLSLEEIYGQTPLIPTRLEQRMLYGAYPEVVQPQHLSGKEYLTSLFNNYLYKDILSYEGIKKHELIVKLIQALALQIGNEYRYLELANTLWSDKQTIAKYMLILEQAFIITTLPPLYSNQRKEIKSHKKVYFRDLWVRNAAINNFSPLHMRNDVWQLRENLCIIERTKYISYYNLPHKQYFWRISAGPEIDYIEQSDNQYDCREFKYSTNKGASLPAKFADTYEQHSFTVIRPDTIGEFVR